MKMNQNAQTVLEYTFCIIIILLLIYGAMMAFRWAGLSLAERQMTHESTLTDVSRVNEQWETEEDSPLQQLQKDFYNASPMNMVFNNW